jgi:hypothetical protein
MNSSKEILKAEYTMMIVKIKFRVAIRLFMFELLVSSSQLSTLLTLYGRYVIVGAVYNRITLHYGE